MTLQVRYIPELRGLGGAGGMPEAKRGFVLSGIKGCGFCEAPCKGSIPQESKGSYIKAGAQRPCYIWLLGCFDAQG